MQPVKKSHIFEVTLTLWEWYRSHKRLLPWRDLRVSDDTQRAYMIFVSEMMLQQTQVPRVIPAFERFLTTFPTLSSLAAASNKDIILAWQGMGYNMRALRLRDAARTIQNQFNGVFPREYDELLSIKGIGPYTAAAIRNFAFDLPTACIDTNIDRIIRRVFFRPTDIIDQKSLLRKTGEVLTIALETNNSTKDWHAALMDFGSAVCKKTNPLCEACPLNTVCKSAFKVKNTASIKAAEPGRVIAGKHIPNRIFRGRIVEALRSQQAGLTTNELGRIIAPDWSVASHKAWLETLIARLKKDQLIIERGQKIVLAD